jgi:hypothetical protein
MSRKGRREGGREEWHKCTVQKQQLSLSQFSPFPFSSLWRHAGSVEHKGGLLWEIEEREGGRQGAKEGSGIGKSLTHPSPFEYVQACLVC